MIGRREIDERVREWGLREDIVEKDYVLGWLLAVIGRHPALQGTWVFKGGTCLKKCYFETYRFSEDLDFTVTAELPPLNHFWAALPEVFNWLEGRLKPAVLPALPLARDEQPTWAPPPTVTTWGASVPLETIRFAAVNRLCVELRYRDAKGAVATRVIEPYSLRRTQDNKLVLHALRADNREHRSYRVDRILGLRVTDQPFTPVYEVEFSAIGSIRAPGTAGSHRVTGTGRRHGSFVRRSAPRYVLECAVCGKRFYRKTRDQHLRPHKDEHGSSCSGRRAILVDTIYD